MTLSAKCITRSLHFTTSRVTSILGYRGVVLIPLALTCLGCLISLNYMLSTKRGRYMNLFYFPGDTIEDQKTMRHFELCNGERTFKETEIDVRCLNSNESFPRLPLIPYLNSTLLPRLLNSEQYEVSLQLLGSIVAIFEEAGITPVMMYGTLAGSYVAHDILTWDDDADIILPFKDLPKVKRLFRDNDYLWEIYEIHSFHGGKEGESEFDRKTLKAFPLDAKDKHFYNIHYGKPSRNGTKINHKFKFFYKKGLQKFKSYPWTWPFIDMDFYSEDATHVWPVQKPSCKINKSSMYPLTYRPLGRLWILAPFEPRAFLMAWYKRPFTCVSVHWNHMKERGTHAYDVDCGNITSYYPFVKRQVIQGGLQESIYLNRSLIYTLKLNGTVNDQNSDFAIAPGLLT